MCVNECLDVVNIRKKFNEIELLKLFTLNKCDMSLFNALSNNIVIPSNNDININELVAKIKEMGNYLNNSNNNEILRQLSDEIKNELKPFL